MKSGTKGHDLLLEIWPEVRQRIPRAKLVIAGGGDDKAQLEAKHNELGLHGAVEGFVGRVSDEELQRLYHDCTFFVMPSRHEGFGLVFLEAMLAGKPCIGAVGSASEIIEHDRTGFVFEADDRQAIQSACLRLFGDTELATRMGESGRNREAERFSRRNSTSGFWSSCSTNEASRLPNVGRGRTVKATAGERRAKSDRLSAEPLFRRIAFGRRFAMDLFAHQATFGKKFASGFQAARRPDFLPTLVRMTKSHRRVQQTQSPLFPGYLFVAGERRRAISKGRIHGWSTSFPLRRNNADRCTASCGVCIAHLKADLRSNSSTSFHRARWWKSSPAR